LRCPAMSGKSPNIFRIYSRDSLELIQYNPRHRLRAKCELVTGAGVILLCIDDEPIGLKVRKMLLEREGYHVLTALSGPEGLELFINNTIEAVVLDYSMPGMNGDEVAAEMKRLKPAVKILLLSAYVDLPDEALKFVDRRAVKGVSPTDFLAELQELLACS
jgi:CheY-like chemotaxis protein